MSCVYCDTRYAETGETMSLDAIMTEVRRAGVKLVEITGGEPLMQKATPTLAGMLLNEGFEVMLETNGACDITVMPDGVRRIVDCKLPGSGMWEYNLWSNFDHLTRLDEVKFVVSSKSDFECALKVIKDYSLDGKCEVLYSPVFGKVEFAAQCVVGCGLILECVDVYHNRWVEMPIQATKLLISFKNV